MILKHRAQEILSLADKTKRDFMQKDEALSGTISIGSDEFRSTEYLAKIIAGFHKKYPNVKILIILTPLFALSACGNSTSNEGSSSNTQQSGKPNSTLAEESNNQNTSSEPEEETSNQTILPHQLVTNAKS